jgi:hypothetical protein
MIQCKIIVDDDENSLVAQVNNFIKNILVFHPTADVSTVSLQYQCSINENTIVYSVCITFKMT